jgi:hypothetical protein
MYQYRPLILEQLIHSWFDGISTDSVNVGPNFLQQVGKDGSIPDAIIDQQPFRIVIETKLNGNFQDDQNKRHGRHFAAYGQN